MVDAVAGLIQGVWSHGFGPESWLLLTASRGLCLTLYGLAVMRCVRYGRWWNLLAVLLFVSYFVGATVDSTWDRPRERQVLTVGLTLMNAGHIIAAIGLATPRRRAKRPLPQHTKASRASAHMPHHMKCPEWGTGALEQRGYQQTKGDYFHAPSLAKRLLQESDSG